MLDTFSLWKRFLCTFTIPNAADNTSSCFPGLFTICKFSDSCQGSTITLSGRDMAGKAHCIFNTFIFRSHWCLKQGDNYEGSIHCICMWRLHYTHAIPVQPTWEESINPACYGIVTSPGHLWYQRRASAFFDFVSTFCYSSLDQLGYWHIMDTHNLSFKVCYTVCTHFMLLALYVYSFHLSLQ